MSNLLPIKHFALTAHPLVHDEEALTSLELLGRISSKMNECIASINEQYKFMMETWDELRESLYEIFQEELDRGNIPEYLNQELLEAVRVDLEALNARIDSIIAVPGDSEAGSEIVDARTSSIGTIFASLGAHIRALENGQTFDNAVRPGTVKAGRIMAGMLGGDMYSRYTIRETVPMAGHWNANGYYDSETGELMEHSSYAISDPIPCKYGDTFILNSYLFGNKVTPAAIFRADGSVIGTAGKAGAGSWDMIYDEVHVYHGEAAYIRFICGAGEVANFRAARIAMRTAPDRVTNPQGNGYIHLRAKKRSDSAVGNIAQIKCWFKLPENHTGNMVYDIPVQLHKYTNLSGWTMRIFAATSDNTYDSQLAFSASGYSFTPAQGLHPYFTVPVEIAEGVKVTHVCFFLDFAPVDGDGYMNAYLMPLKMGYTTADRTETVQPSIEATGYTVHSGNHYDWCNVVGVAAGSSPLYQKIILGVGDSLMRGNTLEVRHSWFNLVASEKDMYHANMAQNGYSLPQMREYIETYYNACVTHYGNPNYFILQGGANDLRLNVALDDTRTAIREIVAHVREKNPKIKILLLTNWKRSEFVNGNGLRESDYVEVMLEEAENLGLHVVNNWAMGLDLTNEQVATWADEGIVSGGEANIHFSKEANQHISSSIMSALEAL